ncbi:3TM-type holin [Azospirillum sp. sgz301742]
MGIAIGGLAAAAVSTALPLADAFVRRLLNLIPDPAGKAAAEAEWATLLLAVMRESDERQSRVNEIEAGSDSLFKSGWRPATGWLCLFGLAMETVVYPLLGWALTLWSPGTPLPQVQTEVLTSLLAGLLGLGGYRTIERWKGRV